MLRATKVAVLDGFKPDIVGGMMHLEVSHWRSMIAADSWIVTYLLMHIEQHCSIECLAYSQN
jgi:hypothetical protein